MPTSKGLLYPSLAHAFGVPWSKLSKRVPRVYPALQLLLEQGNETPVEALEQVTLTRPPNLTLPLPAPPPPPPPKPHP